MLGENWKMEKEAVLTCRAASRAGNGSGSFGMSRAGGGSLLDLDEGPSVDDIVVVESKGKDGERKRERGGTS
jgi:hypothetical protein